MVRDVTVRCDSVIYFRKISGVHSFCFAVQDDVEEESAVIEDRETRISSGGRDTREDRDSPPRCQGCHDRAAQFVCAGCGNQWYCSRECQVKYT